MRRGQSTLEYICLIGILAAALFWMSVYMKRGFQGKVRGLADQIGEQYSPGNVSLSTKETKRQLSNTISISSTKVVYGKSKDTTTGTSNTVDNTTSEVSKYSKEETGAMANDLWP